MNESGARRPESVRPYQLFILALCLYAIVVLAIEAVVPLSPSTRQVLGYTDTGVCMVFLVDFLLSFARAPRRWQYFYRWGWIDLLSSIPAIPILRIGRVARIVRVVRLLRGFRATRILASFVLNRRAESAVLAATLVTILMVAFSAVAILHCESTPEANIKSAQDAVWWAIVTITTVGYGDKYPVTAEGRVVAAMLMVAGVGLFGTFAGFVASWFLQPSSRRESGKIEQLEAKIDDLAEIVGTQGKIR
ncbi:MAG: ion transporter [Candidatus Eisenbacteria bacterium]|nr:ion transporter [Candidatus Eisenbacteria bacterium]